MISVMECSEVKFKFLYQNVKDIVDRMKYINGYDEGMRVLIGQIIQDNSPFRNRNENNWTYFVDGLIVQGAKPKFTKYFFQDGIRAVAFSDGKELMVIAQGKGVILHRKSGVRSKILEKLVLDDIRNINSITLEMDEEVVVNTGNLVGTCKRVSEKYCLLKFNCINIPIDYVYYGEIEGYCVFIDIDTLSILNNKVYSKVRPIGKITGVHSAGNIDNFGGMFMCHHKTKQQIHDIIDTENDCRTVLSGVHASLVDKYLIVVKRITGSNHTCAVYRFDKESRALVTVIPEIENAYAKSFIYGNIKEVNENITLYSTHIGDASYEGVDPVKEVAKIYLNRQGNCADFVDWLHRPTYEKVKADIYKVV